MELRQVCTGRAQMMWVKQIIADCFNEEIHMTDYPSDGWIRFGWIVK